MGRAAAAARIAGHWIFAAILLTLSAQAYAAEIKVLSSNATRTLLEAIGPMFEKASGQGHARLRHIAGDGEARRRRAADLFGTPEAVAVIKAKGLEPGKK